MSFKRLFWLALLLPQLAWLLYLAFGQMQLLRYQLQFHPSQAFRNHVEMTFDAWEFGLELFGVVLVIGLCAMRRWARVLYLLPALCIFVDFVFYLGDAPPGPDRHSWLDSTLFALVLATVILSFVPGLFFPRRESKRG